jgi:hypothetical protein
MCRVDRVLLSRPHGNATSSFSDRGCLLLPTINPPLLAQEPAPTPPPHVRSLSAGARELVAMGGARSALIRSFLDHLEGSDLVVYVDLRWFADTRIGQLLFMGTAHDTRYVVIQIARGRIVLDQLAALGHELRHAVEVADASAVVDRRSLVDHYTHIGIDVGSVSNRQFETEAAVSAGRHVKNELVGHIRSRGDQ